MSKPHTDLTGKCFGRLTAISLTRKAGRPAWLCVCECGNIKEVLTNSLRRGFTKSCGCYQSECVSKRMKLKGFKNNPPVSRSPEYKCWAGMIRRCYYEIDPSFKKYGAKGISVCDRWRYSFPNFLTDMGPKPTLKHSIDRYPDSKGDYEPGNCRWATNEEQMLNRSNMEVIEYKGVTKTRWEWAKQLGIKSYVLKQRLQKWPIDKAMTTYNTTTNKNPPEVKKAIKEIQKILNVTKTVVYAVLNGRGDRFEIGKTTQEKVLALYNSLLET